MEPEGILNGSATSERKLNAITPAIRMVLIVSPIPEFFLPNSICDALKSGFCLAISLLSSSLVNCLVACLVKLNLGF